MAGQKKFGEKIGGSAFQTAFGLGDNVQTIYKTTDNLQLQLTTNDLTIIVHIENLTKEMYSQRPLSYAPTPYSYTPNPARSATINLDEVWILVSAFIVISTNAICLRKSN